MTKQELDEILSLVNEVETKVRLQYKHELVNKIYFTNSFKKIRTFLQTKLTAYQPYESEQSQIAHPDQPLKEDNLSIQERLDTEQTSKELNQAHTLWRQIKETFSSAIRSTDKTVINLSSPARPHETLHNSFDESTGIALMTVSTNSDAYVLTKDDKGHVRLTSARFWKSKQSAKPTD